MRYALKGEMVFCEKGHEIGRITRDLDVGDPAPGDAVEGFKLADGDAWPRCKCGAWFTAIQGPRGSGFIFAEGMHGEPPDMPAESLN